MKKFIFLALLIATVAQADQTSNLGRLGVDWPDLSHPGGAALETHIHDAVTRMSDNVGSRYEAWAAQADSTTVTHTHNLGITFAAVGWRLFTGTHPTLTLVCAKVSDCALAGWTVAAGATPETQIDVTAPVAGGPHDFALVVTNSGLPSDLQTAYENEDTITTTATPVTIDGAAAPASLVLKNGTNGHLQLDGSTSGKIDVTAPAVITDWTLTLPPNAGNSGQVLVTDGSGTATWGSTGTLSSIQNWGALASGTDDVEDIAYSPSLKQFVAIGGQASFEVQTSVNSVDWTAQTVPQAGSWREIVWSETNGLWCAISSSGTERIMTSPDGVTWTLRTQPESNAWLTLAWDEDAGLFVAGANSGTNRFMTSSDGVTWTARAHDTGAGSIRSVDYSDSLSLWVAMSYGSDNVQTSADGITWTDATSAASDNWNDVIWVEELGLFVASALGTDVDHIQTSPDGTTWTLRTHPSAGVGTIVWSAELGILLSTGTNAGDFIWSRNAIDWYLGNMGNGLDLDVNAENIIWAADYGSFFVASSTSGILRNGGMMEPPHFKGTRSLINNMTSGSNDAFSANPTGGTGDGFKATHSSGSGGRAFVGINDAASTTMYLENQTADAPFLQVQAGTSGDIEFEVPATVTSYDFRFPPDAGTVDYVLRTDGNGVTSWVAVSAELSTDLTPQLGGDLDLATFKVTEGATRVLHLTGTSNTWLGEDAGNLSVTGTFNLGVGFEAGKSLAGGAGNVFLGPYAGRNATSGNNTVLIGNSAGLTAANTTDSVGIGTNVFLSTTGTKNVAVGREAGKSLTTGGSNTLVGYRAGEDITGTQTNTYIGFQAAKNDSAAGTTGANVAVGADAGATMSGSIAVTLLGAGADVVLAGTDDAVAIGASAQAAEDSVSIGRNAGLAQTTGAQQNTFVGFESGKAVTTGLRNTLIGYHSGEASTTGKDNVMLGHRAGESMTDARDNVYIGSLTGINDITPSSGDIGNNTAVGKRSAETLNGGTNNVFLGALSDVTSASLDNAMALGANAEVDASNKVRIGDDSMQTVEFAPNVTIQPDGGSLRLADAAPTMKKQTADPCGTYNEGTMFYNDTSDYMCFCDGAGNDVQVHSPATACF